MGFTRRVTILISIVALFAIAPHIVGAAGVGITPDKEAVVLSGNQKTTFTFTVTNTSNEPAFYTIGVAPATADITFSPNQIRLDAFASQKIIGTVSAAHGGVVAYTIRVLGQGLNRQAVLTDAGIEIPLTVTAPTSILPLTTDYTRIIPVFLAFIVALAYTGFVIRKSSTQSLKPIVVSPDTLLEWKEKEE